MGQRRPRGGNGDPAGAPRGRGVPPPPRPAPPSLRGPVDGPPESVEDEVPRPDIADLATPEAGLEVGDPRMGQAPQVVRRGAGLARRADRLPLPEGVGPGFRP